MVVERALCGAAEEATGEAVGAEAPSGAPMGVSAGTTAGVSVGVVTVGAGTAVEEVGAGINLGMAAVDRCHSHVVGECFSYCDVEQSIPGFSVDRIASQLV